MFGSTILSGNWQVAAFFLSLYKRGQYGIGKSMKKIALLFLTRGGLNQPKFWKEQIERAKGRISFYIHSKEKIGDPYFDKHRVEPIIPTSWACHIEAWRILLKKALKYTHNYKFIFLSEACIPLYPLPMLADYLLRDNTSYMGFSKPWWSGEKEREFKKIPEEHRWGNHEWVILSRQHANMVVQDNLLYPQIKELPHSHEAYFATFFSMKGELEKFGRNPTYASFDIKNSDGSYPYLFKTGSDEEWEILLNGWRTQSLFIRKVAPSFPRKDLDEIMEGGKKIAFPD